MLFRKSTAVHLENHVKCLKTWCGQKEALAHVLFDRVKSLRQLKGVFDLADGRVAKLWTYEGWNFNSGNYLFTTATK